MSEKKSIFKKPTVESAQRPLKPSSGQDERRPPKVIVIHVDHVSTDSPATKQPSSGQDGLLPPSTEVKLENGPLQTGVQQLPSGQGVVPDNVAYVNPKQYYRILRRRIARAKLEAKWNISFKRERIVCESRSKHAKSRPRDKNGKFLNKYGVEPKKEYILIEF